MCKSFHSCLNNSFYKPHPDRFTFVEKLKEFQVNTYVQIQGLNVQHTVRNTHTKNKEHVENLMGQYSRHEITRLRFVQRATCDRTLNEVIFFPNL